MAENELQILIGLKIKNYRIGQKYTQEQLCSVLNIDISGLSKIENGKNFPSFEMLCKFIKVLKIDPVEFFDFINYDIADKNNEWLLLTERIKSLNSKEIGKVSDFIKILKS